MKQLGTPAKVAGGAIFLAIVALFLTFPWWYNTVPAGNRGVYTEFGAVKTDTEVKPGVKLVVPFIQGVHNMNVRYQTLDENGLSIKTEDGLNIKADASLRYRVEPDKAVHIYKTYGPDYVETSSLRQEFKEALKNTADNYDEEIYKGKRQEYTNDVEKNLRDSINATGIEIDAVQVKNINLPQRVEKAIEKKVSKKHEIQAAKRQVKVEKQQARAKIEEAKGTRRAMEIIQERLSGKTGERWVRLQFIREGLEKGDVVYMMGDPSKPFTFNEPLPQKGSTN